MLVLYFNKVFAIFVYYYSVNKGRDNYISFTTLLLKGTVDKWLHVLLRHFDGELHTDYEEEELGEPGQRYEAQLQACVCAFGDEIGEHGTEEADCPQRTCVDEG